MGCARFLIKAFATNETGERKAFKNALRTALRGRARDIPLTAQEDSVLIRLAQFKDLDPHGARLLAAWAIGTRLTVLAYHERCCPRTLLTRLDASLNEYLGK
jgi:hypothetical protein